MKSINSYKVGFFDGLMGFPNRHQERRSYDYGYYDGQKYQDNIEEIHVIVGDMMTIRSNIRDKTSEKRRKMD